MTVSANQLLDRFQKSGPMILDGGLATELQLRGQYVDDPLWSARVLIDEPGAIRQLHLDYLNAGAECLITATYQATFAGLAQAGMDSRQAEKLIRSAVRLAIEARDQWSNGQENQCSRAAPLIAASVGPYGAFLHDGSEYTGDYRLSRTQLADFHRQRMQILADSGADLLACETIPSLWEAETLLGVLTEIPGAVAWFSFSCRNETDICHGEPIVQCAKLLGTVPQVVAVGVNCTAPRYVAPLITAVRSETDKPIVVYPNSGETWDRENRRWTGSSDADEFAKMAREWREAGAQLIGGCCRTGPKHIRALRSVLVD